MSIGLTEPGGGKACKTAEGGREAGLRGKAAEGGDLGQRRSGGGQELLGARDAAMKQVLMRGEAGGPAEKRREVGRAQGGGLRQGGE